MTDFFKNFELFVVLDVDASNGLNCYVYLGTYSSRIEVRVGPMEKCESIISVCARVLLLYYSLHFV